MTWNRVEAPHTQQQQQQQQLMHNKNDQFLAVGKTSGCKEESSD